MVLIEILTSIFLYRHVIFYCLIGECLRHLDAEEKINDGVVSWHATRLEFEAKAFVAFRFFAVMSVINVLPSTRDFG